MSPLVIIWCLFLVLSYGKLITIDNNKPWLDNKGNIMNIHEGHLVRWEENGLFYFYGMQYELCPDDEISCNATQGCGCKECGHSSDHNVSIYTSPNMTSGSWEYRGTIFNESMSPQRPKGRYFRTFIFYNNQTSKYVLWNMYASKSYYMSSQSDSPLGPFVIKNKNITMGHQGKHGDFYGFQDPQTNKAYIVYNSDGNIAVDELTEDYLLSTQKTSALFNHSGHQEAPLIFKRNNIYYVLTGHGCCVCLAGSDSNLYISENGNPLGPYKFINNIGAFNNGTSRTQSEMAGLAIIKQANGSLVYLWSGDRWQQAPDGKHGHDPQIWQPLKFKDDNGIDDLLDYTQLKSFQIDINPSSSS